MAFTEGSKNEELCNVREKNTPERTKFEKENLDSDDSIKSYTLRKREHEMLLTLNDKEKIVDKSKKSKKSSKFGLTEARGFNNESVEDKMQDEEKLEIEKVPLRVTRGYVQRHLKLKSKMSNDTKKLQS